jgi:predicted ribosomally synthesized peptide with nif11-like leader
MTENMKAFLEKVSSDEALKEKVKALESIKDLDKCKAAAVELAKEAGFTLADEDFVSDTAEGELSDSEMDAVAGGVRPSGCGIFGMDLKYMNCSCIFDGMGDFDMESYKKYEME